MFLFESGIAKWFVVQILYKKMGLQLKCKLGGIEV